MGLLPSYPSFSGCPQKAEKLIMGMIAGLFFIMNWSYFKSLNLQPSGFLPGHKVFMGKKSHDSPAAQKRIKQLGKYLHQNITSLIDTGEVDPTLIKLGFEVSEVNRCTEQWLFYALAPLRWIKLISYTSILTSTCILNCNFKYREPIGCKFTGSKTHNQGCQYYFLQV